LSKSFDALHTLREDGPLKAFVMTTLNKLPQIKPDLVRTDDKWVTVLVLGEVKNRGLWKKGKVL
jgi:hypothetical protein